MRRDLDRSGPWRLTDRKIFGAVMIGILLGAAYFSLTNNRGPSEGELVVLHGSEEEDARQLRRQIADVKNEMDKLQTILKHRLAEKDEAVAKAGAEEEQQASAEEDLAEGDEKKVKGGPFGTVKASRTNPTVIPNRDANPELAAILEKIAINNEIVVGVSNIYIRDMLEVWVDSLKRVGVTNAIVIALDDEVVAFCKERGMAVYRMKAQLTEDGKEMNDNHGISGTKFRLLRDFLVLGYSILLSDIDIVFLQNPFVDGHLKRDCDVEGMSDGFDNATAYGYNDVTDDPSMGWARYAHTMRVFVMNSGLFFMRPTLPSIELLDRVRQRLIDDKDAWDQAVFNEEQFFPSSPSHSGLHISRRILDYYKFMNSKVLFKEVRKDQYRFAKFLPVSIHVNYHPDKEPRMRAVVDFYVNKNRRALQPFPDGSE